MLSDQLFSHFVEFDRIHRGRKSIAVCGDWTDERDISNDPTCPECIAELAKTADDVFGTEAPGTPVRSTWGNPTAGYTPKGARS